jgi:hypothetical protein
MAIVSLVTLKTYFETGDFPTQQEFINLIDTLGQQNNLRTVSYIIGAPGVTGCDHNFTSVANATEQSIQLGSTTIIPAKSLINNIISHCVDGLNGVITGTADLGNTSSGSEYKTAMNLDDTNEIIGAVDSTSSFYSTVSISASSVYFSFTPSANWNTITNGKWKVWITYLDNSLL